MFIRKSKYKAMQNEILRLTNVNEAWELQNKSDLDKIRLLQKHNSALHEEVASILIKHEQLEADHSHISKELEAAKLQVAELTIKNNRLTRALNASPHGGSHGN